ncbi:MAG: urease accessory protein UreF [Sarcina sp.]
MYSLDTVEILRMLQLCDSQFPVGSFNHSYGMENYLRTGKIDDAKSLNEWLKAFLKDSFAQTDALAIRFVFEALEKNKVEDIWELDTWMAVQSIPMETRNGAKLVARRMCELLLDLYDNDILVEYQKMIKTKEAYGHPAIAFAILMHGLEIPLKRAIMYHMYATVSTLVQNAVRTIPLGQKDGQIILKEFADRFESFYSYVETLTEDDFGANVPGIEMSQIKHETQIFRLFMS